MASIPNMRSTPLPLPAAKAAPVDGAPGDFAAQMPAVRGRPTQPVPPVPEQPAEGVELLLSEIGEAILPPGEDGDAPESKAETSEASETPDTIKTGQTPVPAVIIPFVPVQPASAGPQELPTVAAGETPPVDSHETRAEAPVRPVAQPASGTANGKAMLPQVATGTKSLEEAPSNAPQPEAKPAEAQPQTQAGPQLEAAVKELLQRKQVLPKPAGRTAKETAPVAARPEATAMPAQGQAPAPIQPQPAAPVPAPVTQAISEPLPPLLAATPPQSTPLKAEAPRTVEGARIADVAVDRQFDLARDGQWLDRLARDIAAAGSNDSPLRFRLHPQTLGHLQVELQQGDHGTAVRLTVETEAARQILADAQPRLAAEARAQGVRIAETHVDLSGSGRHAPGDQRRQDEARHNPMIRTAPGAGEDAVASARASRRAGLDRYA